ncbi:Na+/H+ antiporter subunit C [Xiashengella succiniciproducens]|uniref:Na+/H+ antiporter subunit C n=1 Tax=Xiashengella succiniciproducens TaxID=2949635 RepID=A0A9J6ZLX8_9BACT|nr:Na+/H+ antiporter subunit C [Alkaliflexus sp. Ai-910]MDI9538136.1 Na+/H+ antiporter subunit C [Bacteroidota bacterium]URW78741.1 Na+/H+ antiporter subunit C [Alkaliflexus sp. Ai-910]HHU01229.1 Na+/H+ antiporter subunit C [Bacteroidales bacterium]
MEYLIAIFIGLLYGCGVFLVLRRSLVKVILGIFLLSNATNLIIFLSGGITRGGTPIIEEGAEAADIATISDPIPQALILTAIVIGLGMSAYILALKYRYFDVTGTHDLDQLKNTDQK